jgi:hypothetical protein
MPRYTAFDPATEFNGTNVMAFVTNMQHEDIAEILERHGLTKIDPDQWYPLQKVLDVMSDIADRAENVSANFVSLGMAATLHGIETLPAEVKALPLMDFLMLYGKIYPTRFRNGDPGTITATKVDDTHMVIDARIPMPDDTLYGVFYGLARHFRAEGQRFTLAYDETLPRHDTGGEFTRLHLYLRD